MVEINNIEKEDKDGSKNIHDLSFERSKDTDGFVAFVSNQEDLTRVRGIGSLIATKLQEAGYRTIGQLANSSLDALSKVKGFGPRLAEKIVISARNYLNGSSDEDSLKLVQKNLSEINKVPSKITLEKEIDSDMQGEDYKSKQLSDDYEMYNDEQSTISNLTDESDNFDDEQVVDSIKEVKSSEADTIGSINTSLDDMERIEEYREEPLNEDENDDYQQKNLEAINIDNENERLPHALPSSNHVSVIVSDFLDESPQIQVKNDFMHPPGLSSKKKKTTIEVLKETRLEIKTVLKKSGFQTISKNQVATSAFHEKIDLLAFHIYTINEFLDIIQLVPIIIYNTNMKLIVSESSIRYQKREIEIEDNDNQIFANFDRLNEIQEHLFENLTSENHLVQFFKTYLQTDLIIEKTFLNKRLFFRSGPVQFKIIVDPVLVTLEKVTFLEKKVSFPYQRGSNLHVVQTDQLAELLEFFEKKYYCVETYLRQKNCLGNYFASIEKFSNSLRLVSIPFVVLGFAFLMMLFLIPSAISILSSLSHATIILFFVTTGFLYLKFREKKKEIEKEFNTPYYQLPVKFDETDIMAIAEELPESLFEQFIYECFGKDEQNLAVSYLEKQKFQKRTQEAIGEKVKTARRENIYPDDDKKIEHYSSFLED